MHVTAPKIPTSAAPTFRTADEWLRSLGNVPLERIVFDPLPGTATIEETIHLVDGDENRAVELVNGTLVEKPVGFKESLPRRRTFRDLKKGALYEPGNAALAALIAAVLQTFAG
jgi:hypothetical protein